MPVNNDEIRLREIGKKLGITGADYTDSFSFLSRNGQPLTEDERSAAMGGNQVRWDLPALTKLINDQLRVSGPATVRDLKNDYGDLMGWGGSEIMTSAGRGFRKPYSGVGPTSLAPAAPAPSSAPLDVMGRTPAPLVKAPNKTPIVFDENARVGGLADNALAFINNLLIPKMRNQERQGLWGLTPAAGQFANDVLAEPVDGVQRFLSDTTKAIQKPLFGTTLEDRLMREAAQQNPELRQKLKTRYLRSQLAGLVFTDPKSRQKFTFDEQGRIVRA